MQQILSTNGSSILDTNLRHSLDNNKNQGGPQAKLSLSRASLYNTAHDRFFHDIPSGETSIPGGGRPAEQVPGQES